MISLEEKAYNLPCYPRKISKYLAKSIKFKKDEKIRK